MTKVTTGLGRVPMVVMAVFLFGLGGCGGDEKDPDVLTFISRTSAGVPTIKVPEGVSQERATPLLFRAQGYAEAADRFYQMDRLRRQVLGTWSELAGKEGLPHDKLVVALGFRARADQLAEQFKHAHPRLWVYLNEYALGVNQYVERHREGLEKNHSERYGKGAKVDGWSSRDCIAVALGYQFLFSSQFARELAMASEGAEFVEENWEELSAFFSSPQTQEQEHFLPEGYPLLSLTSNLRQVFHSSQQPQSLTTFPFGGLSRRGATTVALKTSQADQSTFLSTTLVGTMSKDLAPYEIALNSTPSGGTAAVSGFSFPGTPGVFSGMSNNGAFAYSPSPLDVDDTYLEFLGNRGRAVEFGRDKFGRAKRVPLKTRIERISYREKGELKTLTLETHSLGHRGNLFSQALAAAPLNDLRSTLDQELALSYRWLGLERANAAALWLGLATARNIEERTETIAAHGLPGDSFVLTRPGDAPTHFFPDSCPKRPYLSQPIPPFMPVPGLGEHEWKTTKTTPLSYKSEVVIADGSLTTTVPESAWDELVPCAWWRGAPQQGTRIRHLVQGLTPLSGDIDRRDLENIQQDTRDAVARGIVDEMMDQSAGRGWTEAERKARADLTDWDGNTEKGRGAHLAYSWIDSYMEKVAQEKLGTAGKGLVKLLRDTPWQGRLLAARVRDWGRDHPNAAAEALAKAVGPKPEGPASRWAAVYRNSEAQSQLKLILKVGNANIEGWTDGPRPDGSTSQVSTWSTSYRPLTPIP